MIRKEAVLVQKKIAPISRQAAAEGIVLLKNENAVLPFTTEDNIALFGRCQINTYRSGTGSGGAVNVPYEVSVLEGLSANTNITLNQALADTYRDWVRENPMDDGGGGWAAEPWFQQEMPLTDSVVKAAAQQSNKAVVIIGRTAGEDQDNAEEQGSYLLTDAELDMITRVNGAFEKVVIVLNTTNIIDMSWLDTVENHQSIQAVMYNWAAGMEGGHALADVLCGKESPSGRLVDSIAYKLSDYPSAANFGRTDFNLYVEDIYLGYKYFETFNKKAVQYEFGFGLSYTNFTQTLVAFTKQGEGKDALLHFEIEVKNTGEQYTGKEVVQLYVEAPQGELGQPARSLVGFTKTDKLAPQASQVVRISVKVADLASYDDSGSTGNKSCYVLEAGDYSFYLGESVRKAVKVTSFNQPDLLVTERLVEAMAPIASFERIKPQLTETGELKLGYEVVPGRTIDLEKRIKDNLPKTLEMTGDQGIKLIDVADGKANMEQFIAQLSEQDLVAIVRGEGMCSAKVTAGVAAAFGGVTNSLFEFGIPVVAASDGPSGIRMDSGHQASQVPVGTLLGCTWNCELNQALYQLVGEEMQANEVDTLLGPGMNIHRHPLNGRNFEYFSEDPFLTGMMAAAQTLGLKQAGVTGTIKHFIANDQEKARTEVDSVISERAIRQLHIKPFEMAVKQGEASSIMTAYNPVNGHWTASNYDLNTTILRKEWGYTGIVMTDWWAKMNHPSRAGEAGCSFTSYMVRSQNDLYMVVGVDGAEPNAMEDDSITALESGTLSLGELQRSAMNICRFILNTPAMKRPLKAYEPINTFTANQESSETFSLISEPLNLMAEEFCSATLKVENAGTYRVEAYASYARDALAQSSCSLSLNDVYSMSIPVNGTEGEVVKVDGLPVILAPGYYTVDVNFVKPGLILHELRFIAE